jgi:hypothetical protein
MKEGCARLAVCGGGELCLRPVSSRPLRQPYPHSFDEANFLLFYLQTLFDSSCSPFPARASLPQTVQYSGNVQAHLFGSQRHLRSTTVYPVPAQPSHRHRSPSSLRLRRRYLTQRSSSCIFRSRIASTDA